MLSLRRWLGPTVIATALVWGGLQGAYDRVAADEPFPYLYVSSVHSSATLRGLASTLSVVDYGIVGDDDGWTVEQRDTSGDWRLVATDRDHTVTLHAWTFYRVKLYTGGVEEVPSSEVGFVAYDGRSYAVTFYSQDAMD